MLTINEPFVYAAGAVVPDNVTHVVIDPSIKVIPSEEFEYRLQLKEVVLPEGLLEIRKGAFRNCELLERINLPPTLVKIGNGAFWACSSLTELVCPEGLLEIEKFAFYQCKLLTRIIFASNLVTIGECAFSRCISLKKAVFPEGLLEIGKSAFLNCYSLAQITCPSTLIRIGAHAFSCCASLQKVTMMGRILTMEWGAFYLCPLDHYVIPSRALVVEFDENGTLNCRMVTDGAITHTDAGWVMIAPECLNSISLSNLKEVQCSIRIAMGAQVQSREEEAEHDLALIRYYASVEISTILELALWKYEVDKIDDLNPGARMECRIMCGADVIIPGVLDFL